MARELSREKGKTRNCSCTLRAPFLPAPFACLKPASLGKKGSMALESETLLKAEQMKGLPSVNKLF